jgi:hypothetical protein
MTGQMLRGGTWNVERGREPRKVRHEIVGAFEDEGLDWLAVQEFTNYASVRDVSRLEAMGVSVIVFRELDRGQNAIIVRGTVPVANPGNVPLGGDGWRSTGGHWHPPLRMTHALIGGWLRAASLHMAPSVDWDPNDERARPEGPDERVDDYLPNARAVRRFARDRLRSRRGLAIVGDWNSRRFETGVGSPAWIADTTPRLALAYPPGRPPSGGHRGIDYVLHDEDTRIERIEYRDNGGSDHPLVVFDAVRSPRDNAERTR